MASTQYLFKYLLHIYCAYNQSRGAEDSRVEEKYGPCPHRVYSLVHSSFSLLTKRQENVYYRQFLLYKTTPTSIPYLRRETDFQTHQLAQDICQKFDRHFCLAVWNSFFFFNFNLFILERGREKERERHIKVLLPLTPPTGDLARNSGMCPD